MFASHSEYLQRVRQMKHIKKKEFSVLYNPDGTENEMYSNKNMYDSYLKYYIHNPADSNMNGQCDFANVLKHNKLDTTLTDLHLLFDHEMSEEWKMTIAPKLEIVIIPRQYNTRADTWGRTMRELLDYNSALFEELFNTIDSDQRYQRYDGFERLISVLRDILKEHDKRAAPRSIERVVHPNYDFDSSKCWYNNDASI